MMDFLNRKKRINWSRLALGLYLLATLIVSIHTPFHHHQNHSLSTHEAHFCECTEVHTDEDQHLCLICHFAHLAKPLPTTISTELLELESPYPIHFTSFLFISTTLFHHSPRAPPSFFMA